VVEKCTAKNPADRPQGFSTVVADLERMIADLDAPTMVLPETPAPPQPSRPGWLLPVVVLVVVAIAAAGLFFALRPKPVAPAGPAQPVFAKTLATATGEMELVPVGSFLFGEKKEPVTLPAFYVDKTEVTNAAYAAFSDATHRELPAGFAREKPDYPVVNVSIIDAQAFARWAGKRLPSAREWEKAARGTDGRLYPWGNESDPARANVGTKQMQPAAGMVNGASPSGALNMVGNVWELVAELSTPSKQSEEVFQKLLNPPPGPDEPWYTMRGLSFQEPSLMPGAVWDAAIVPARYKDLNIGFRCVKDAQ
jgi:formylglycine-generating enzyme required for sulfatase activity